jgi:hypothetical protein
MSITVRATVVMRTPNQPVTSSSCSVAARTTAPEPA